MCQGVRRPEESSLGRSGDASSCFRVGERAIARKALQHRRQDEERESRLWRGGRGGEGRDKRRDVRKAGYSRWRKGRTLRNGDCEVNFEVEEMRWDGAAEYEADRENEKGKDCKNRVDARRSLTPA